MACKYQYAALVELVSGLLEGFAAQACLSGCQNETLAREGQVCKERRCASACTHHVSVGVQDRLLAQGCDKISNP